MKIDPASREAIDIARTFWALGTPFPMTSIDMYGKRIAVVIVGDLPIPYSCFCYYLTTMLADISIKRNPGFVEQFWTFCGFEGNSAKFVMDHIRERIGNPKDPIFAETIKQIEEDYARLLDEAARKKAA